MYVRSVVSSSREVERPSRQCMLPAERILRKEACDLVLFLRTTHICQSMHYASNWARGQLLSLSSSNGERNCFHFVQHNKILFRTWGPISGPWRICLFGIQAKAVILSPTMQNTVVICLQCKHITTVFCIIPTLNPKSTCNVHIHSGTVLHRLNAEHTKTLIGLFKCGASTAIPPWI